MNTWIGGALVLFFALCGCGMLLSAITRGRYPMRVLVVFSTICSALMMIAAGVTLATQSAVLKLRCGIWTAWVGFQFVSTCCRRFSCLRRGWFTFRLLFL